MQTDESLWPDTRSGRGITSGTFYTSLRRHSCPLLCMK